MEVLGRDSAREAYRVAIDLGGRRVTGLVPERMMASGAPLTGGHGHRTAYDWLARNATRIEQTMTTLATGAGRVSPPFDAVTLAEE